MLWSSNCACGRGYTSGIDPGGAHLTSLPGNCKPALLIKIINFVVMKSGQLREVAIRGGGRDVTRGIWYVPHLIRGIEFINQKVNYLVAISSWNYSQAFNLREFNSQILIKQKRKTEAHCHYLTMSGNGLHILTGPDEFLQWACRTSLCDCWEGPYMGPWDI